MMWKRIAIREHGHVCKKCGSKKNVTLHHIFSKSLYPQMKTDIDNLIPLCRKCHDDYHYDYLKGHLELCNKDTLVAWMGDTLHESVLFYHIQRWLLNELGFGNEWGG